MKVRELIEALKRAPNLDREVEVEIDFSDGPRSVRTETRRVGLVVAEKEYETISSEHNVVTIYGEGSGEPGYGIRLDRDGDAPTA